MPAPVPLSTLLSQVLVAHTIELDNEFEMRLLRSDERAPIVSVVMWSNFLHFVGDGITVGELPAVTGGLPKSRVLSNVGGMERWGYVFVAPDGERPIDARDGRGSSRGLRRDVVIRPTAAGRVAREASPALLAEIDARWYERFGADVVDTRHSAVWAASTLSATRAGLQGCAREDPLAPRSRGSPARSE